MRAYRHRLLAAVSAPSLALMVFSAGAASAQTDSPDEADIGEIVITAQRRSESLQKSALAVTALTGASLSTRGVNTAADLQAQVPGLQIAPQIFGNLQVYIRGVGSSNNMEAGDPAIAFHVDGVYVSRTTATAGLLFDLDRIEVVKGPQGTLYGRNATGGSINVITKKPVFTQEGAASVGYGNFGAIETEGMLNVPLSDTLAVRAAFKTSSHEGYMKAVPGVAGTVGNDRQDQDEKAVRLHVLYKPDDRFSLLVSGDYSHQGGAGGGDQILPLRTNDAYRTIATQSVYLDNSFSNASVEASYDFGFAELTYIAAYRYSDTDRKYEYPLSNYPGYRKDINRSLSNELRLGGTTGPLNWVAGLFTFEEKSQVNLRLQITPTLWSNNNTYAAKSASTAVFAQGTWAFTDRLRGTLGLRYTHDRKSNDGDTLTELIDGTLVAVASINDAYDTWNSTDWKAGIEYDVAPDSLLYVSAGTAYKAGGWFAGVAPNTYEPENLQAYEIGLKNRLFGRRLLLNLAAYVYEYDNLQISSVDVTNGTPRSVTRNAGSASIKGIEIETAYATDGYGRWDGSIAWTDAKYDDFILPFGDSWTNWGTGTQAPADFSGRKMAVTPEWAINLGYEYAFSLPAGGLTWRIQSHYESGKYMEFHQYPTSYQDAFTKTDTSLTYRPDDANWLAQLYVRNIEDEAVLGTAIPPISASPAYSQVFYKPPRTWGVKLSLSF